jgi:hypothetical protein
VRSWEDLEHEWEPTLERLRQDGFDVRYSSIAFPVQLAGRLPGGEPFYFRERNGHAYLGVGGDPVSAPEWKVTENLWDSRVEAEAGRILEPDEAYAVLRRLMELR